jgi:hypothetical protein
VTEEELETAFDSIRDELAPDAADREADPGTDPDRTPPPEAEVEERRAALAAALAEALGLTEADVTAALDEVGAAHDAERRGELGERLDEAVAAGELTAADQQSVLTAFDAGVLGGRGLH